MTLRSSCVLLISGGLGWVSQVPQGGVSCASAQRQRDIWDPVWPPAETNAQEHLLGLGQIRGAALCICVVTSARCPSPRNVSHLVLAVNRFGVINGQICPNTTLEWPCSTTANTDTRPSRTSWRCLCEFPSTIPNYWDYYYSKNYWDYYWPHFTWKFIHSPKTSLHLHWWSKRTNNILARVAQLNLPLILLHTFWDWYRREIFILQKLINGNKVQ